MYACYYRAAGMKHCTPIGLYVALDTAKLECVKRARRFSSIYIAPSDFRWVKFTDDQTNHEYFLARVNGPFEFVIETVRPIPISEA